MNIPMISSRVKRATKELGGSFMLGCMLLFMFKAFSLKHVLSYTKNGGKE
jgi:hypothetical protein